MARRHGKRQDDTFSTEPPDALEMISRLIVGSSYRVPVEGKGGKATLTTSDIAAAVGYMRNRLERDTALAVATRADRRAIARLSVMAYRKVMRAILQQRPPVLQLRDGADRWRLRIVIYDAAHELVWPERRQTYAELARAAKMRKHTYIQAHRCATSTLQEALNNGRRDFGKALWGR